MAKHVPKFEQDPLAKEDFWLITCDRCHKILGRIKLHDDLCPLVEEAEPPALGIRVADGVGAKDKFGKPR